MSSTLIFICIAVAVLITSFISGILGMAGGMILMGVLMALLPLPAAMMLHGITQMASNGWRAWMWRRDVNWQIFRGYAFGALLALSAFILVRVVVSTPVAYILLGLTPFVSFALPKRLQLNVDHRGHPILCGVVCTALQLLEAYPGRCSMFFSCGQRSTGAAWSRPRRCRKRSVILLKLVTSAASACLPFPVPPAASSRPRFHCTLSLRAWCSPSPVRRCQNACLRKCLMLISVAGRSGQ